MSGRQHSIVGFGEESEYDKAQQEAAEFVEKLEDVVEDAVENVQELVSSAVENVTEFLEDAADFAGFASDPEAASPKGKGEQYHPKLTAPYAGTDGGPEVKHQGEKPKGDLLEKAEVNFIRWDPTTFHDRRSKVVYVPDNKRDTPPNLDETCLWAAEDLGIPQWMEETQEWAGGCSAVIAVLGDDPRYDKYINQELGQPPLPNNMSVLEAKVRTRLLFGRGLLTAALDAHAVIVTAGIDLGVSAFIGQGNRDRYHKVPVVGCVGKAQVTWPNDQRGAPSYTERRPGEQYPDLPEGGRIQLQPDHTHLIMVDNYYQDYESVWHFRVEMCKALVSGAINKPLGAKRSTLPLAKVAIVVGGGETAKMEVVNFVRMKWPICLIEGSGGLADEIMKAHTSETSMRDHVPDPYILEIVKDGVIETINFALVDGGAMKTMIHRICSSAPPPPMEDNQAQKKKKGAEPVKEKPKRNYVPSKELQLTWDLVGVYSETEVPMRQRSQSLGALGDFLNSSLICILTTYLFLMLDERGFMDPKMFKEWQPYLVYCGMTFLIVIMCVRAIESRFQYTIKFRVLRAGTELLKSKIYEYRTGRGEYMFLSTAKKDLYLSEEVSQIRMNVVASSVGETHLRHEGQKKVVDRNYEVTEEDDGLSPLSPEEFIQWRLLVLMTQYQTESELENKRFYGFRSLQITLFCLSVFQVCLPVMFATPASFVVFAAITNSGAIILDTFIDDDGMYTRLLASIEAVIALRNVLSWWRGLNPIEMSNPQNFARLVQDTELVLFGYLLSTMPGATAITSAGGHGEGGAGFNATKFKNELSDSIFKGKILFTREMVDGHPVFFEGYNEYLAERMKAELRTEIENEALTANTHKVAVGGKFIQEQDIAEEHGPEYEGVMIHDAQGRLASIKWGMYDFSQRSSKVVPVPNIDMTPAMVDEQLELPDWFKTYRNGFEGGPQAMLVVVGGNTYLDQWLTQDDGAEVLPGGVSEEQLRYRLQLLFSRGLVQGCIDGHALCITSGLDFGVARILGDANRDRRHKLSLVGVCGKGLVTWPGDWREPQNHHELQRLNPDHTHFVMLETPDDLKGVRRYTYEFVESMVKRHNIPSVVLLVNGREQEMAEVLKYSRLGLPVIAVKGTGGAADMLVDSQRRAREEEFVLNSRAFETVKEAVLETIDLMDLDGSLTRVMLKRLFAGKVEGLGSKIQREVLKMAWEKVCAYEETFKVQKQNYLSFTIVIPLCTFLTSLLVILTPGLIFTVDFVGSSFRAFNYVGLDNDDVLFGIGFQVGQQVGPARSDFGNVTLSNSVQARLFEEGRATVIPQDSVHVFVYLLVLAPMLMVVLNSISNEQRYDKKTELLWGGCELLKREIYMFRAGMQNYAMCADLERDDLLATMVEVITRDRVLPGVSDVALIETSIEKLRAKNYEVSEEDDGLSLLAPDEYVSVRLITTCEEYRSAAMFYHRADATASTILYLMLGVAACLAATAYFRLVIIILTATLIISSLSARLSFGNRMTFYNRALSELENTLADWRAYSPIEQANPAKYNRIVKIVEDIHNAEVKAFGGAAGGGGGGGKKSGIPGLEVSDLVQDCISNLLRNGKILFRITWVELHPVFFEQYERWLMKQGFRSMVKQRLEVEMDEEALKKAELERLREYSSRDAAAEFTEKLMRKMGSDAGALAAEGLTRADIQDEVARILEEAKEVGVTEPMVGLKEPKDVGLHDVHYSRPPQDSPALGPPKSAEQGTMDQKMKRLESAKGIITNSGSRPTSQSGERTLVKLSSRGLKGFAVATRALQITDGKHEEEQKES